MAKRTKTISRFVGGIADYLQEGILDSYAFGRSIDVRSDPHNVTLLPRTIKESSTVVQALPKWGEYISANNETYIYDEAGNIYKRTSASAYSLIHNVPASHGNGLSWFGEDNFLYFTSDKLIGRYGPMSSASPQFVDDFFGSQGGTPLNTHSLDLEAGSTQYASRADTASLSITGDLSLEAWVKPESLPTSGNTMSIISKWTENGNARSYKFGIGTVSNWFGDGSDGALTISANTTDAPIDSACSGTVSTTTLTATNASFATGQEILIHQTRGTNVGAWQKNKIQSYTAGTITLVTPLNTTYASSGTSAAQVLVLKQYTNATVNSGVSWEAKAWNGTVGGILAFLANGTVTINGTVSAGHIGPQGGYNIDNQGFRGGSSPAGAGEGTLGTVNTVTASAQGSGGGGAQAVINAGGGGAGHGTVGTVGQGSPAGQPGGISGSADLTTLTFGGGGGGGGNASFASGGGGYGGGIVFISGVTMTVNSSTGFIKCHGSDGQVGNTMPGSGGGGAAGGSIFIKCQTATLETNRLLAQGGFPGTVGDGRGTGGYGGEGRVHIDYLTSYTGTSTPTLTATQDSTLGLTNGYTLFLSVSSNGTNVETYTKPVNLAAAIWQHIAVTWDSSISTAEFFHNAVSQATVVGTLTTISDNSSTFNIGMDRDGSSNPQHLYDGLIDEVRVWAGYRAEGDYLNGLTKQINAASAGLQGYYQFNNVATDATANGNNLTLTGSPVYSTDIPFSSPTTRIDIDQSASPTGNTYTLLTAIAESSADKKQFTPGKDPQKSLMVHIESVGAGAGTWTLTIHDQYNNTIASKSVLKSALSTGEYEFVFDSVWRPLTNFTNNYHFHLTDSDGTGTVRTGSASDLSTAKYTTYYQFLVEDTSFHPIAKMLQFIVFGNERYVAKLEATAYEPNKIALPAGYRVRCFGYWREYLAIGAVKGSSVTEQDSGRVYFWDGIASTYNFYIDVPEGGVTALLGSKGSLYIWAGYQGDMLIYQGGDVVEKIRRVPKIDADTSTEIYPGAVTMWKSLIRYGVAGSSTSTVVNKGVYTFGHSNVRYPDVLTYDYPVSTGSTTGTTLRIGMTLPVNQKLLIGWQDGTGYGVDYVDSSNNCFPTGTIEFLIDDSELIWKEKLANTFVAKVLPLVSGQSIDLKNKVNSASSWTYLGAVTEANSTIARQVIPESRGHEVQVAVDLASTTGISPTLQGIGLESDIRPTERRS